MNELLCGVRCITRPRLIKYYYKSRNTSLGVVFTEVACAHTARTLQSRSTRSRTRTATSRRRLDLVKKCTNGIHKIYYISVYWNIEYACANCWVPHAKPIPAYANSIDKYAAYTYSIFPYSWSNPFDPTQLSLLLLQATRVGMCQCVCAADAISKLAMRSIYIYIILSNINMTRGRNFFSKRGVFFLKIFTTSDGRVRSVNIWLFLGNLVIIFESHSGFCISRTKRIRKKPTSLLLLLCTVFGLYFRKEL